MKVVGVYGSAGNVEQGLSPVFVETECPWCWIRGSFKVTEKVVHRRCPGPCLAADHFGDSDNTYSSPSRGISHRAGRND